MKKIILTTPFILTSLFCVSLSPTEITNMISKIKEERVGIPLVKLEGTLNPFLLKKKEKKVVKEEKKEAQEQKSPEVEYQLSAILNHAAFINKKWYKTGDKLGAYRVRYISRNEVHLKGELGEKVLKLEKKKKFIKVKEGYRRW